MTVEETQKRYADDITLQELVRLRVENEKLQVFKNLAYKMASKRLDSIDDYIRDAKQAIADYENV